MKIGIITSSGGSVFQEVYKIIEKSNLDFTFFVITDRECDIEIFCRENNIHYRRIICNDNKIFSQKTKDYFDSIGGVSIIFLFFLRLVTKDLFQVYPVINTHPSLLPAFQGFNPLERALKAGVKYFGTTIHLVDDTIDGGPIVAQTSIPVTCSDNLTLLNKSSFLQKVYLLLLAIELINNKDIQFSDNNFSCKVNEKIPFSERCNPMLTNKFFVQEFEALQEREGMRVLP